MPRSFLAALAALLIACETSEPPAVPGQAGVGKALLGPEICDGLDNDGDGLVDDDDPSLVRATSTTWFMDRDRDGYGAGAPSRACERPLPLSVRIGGDCDDTDATTNPGAPEVCNGFDDDCDSLVDDDDPGVLLVSGTVYYLDADGDGHGVSTTTTTACDAPEGYSATDGDCDDSDDSVHPDALEVCNDVDDDCNGDMDDEDRGLDTTTAEVWYIDYDGDGYGVTTYSWTTCEAPTGTVDNAEDCDDVAASVSPAATETCNDEDDDCDGTTDEGVGSPVVWFLDHDGDGYGTPDFTSVDCEAPTHFVDNAEDCDDLDGSVSPGALEVDGDGLDNDCVNDAPRIDSVTLSSSAVTTDDVLTVTVAASDPDGDEVTVSTSWTVDGIEVATDTDTLDGASYFSRDQTIVVTATPTDGTDVGIADQATILVSNSPPEAPGVSVGPTEPEAGVDPLVCTIDPESTDADGDSVTYAITWLLDGGEVDPGATTTVWTGDTVDASMLAAEDLWACTVTPDDGTDLGPETTSAELTVAGGGLEWHGDFSACTSADCDGIWPTDNSSYEYVDTGDGVLVSEYRDTSSGGIFVDLEAELGQAISDTQWVLRFAVWNQLTSSGSCSSVQYFDLSAEDTAYGRGDAEDRIGIGFEDYRDFQQYWESSAKDEGSEVYQKHLHDWTSETCPDQVWMWVELIRESATAITISLYTDSTYTTLDRTTSATLTADVNTLRYLKLGSYTSTNCDTTTVVKLDDISFYNSVTSVP